MFLDNFQKNHPEITDEIKHELKQLEDILDEVDGKVKTFHLVERVDSGGMYGMYMAVKRPNEVNRLFKQPPLI